jgi:hypothetical protein
MTRARAGVYPGTFNPPTVAHLHIAAAARSQRALTRVVLAVSVRPIDKEHVTLPLLEHRLAVLREDCRALGDWIGVVTTEDRLLVDIARGYDVLIMGADKWAQVNDAVYYDGSTARRDAAVAALPEVAIAPRPPFPVPVELALRVGTEHAGVSSSAVSAGVHGWMSPAARAFDARTGAWSEPARYERWLAAGGGAATG